jgi:hypothetical protein
VLLALPAPTGFLLPVSQRQLNKRLGEQGLLASKERGKLVTRRAVLGRERFVLHLGITALSPAANRGNRGDRGETPKTKGASP